MRVPAHPDESVSVVTVAVSAVALSDAIGGGLLDDSVQGTADGGRYVMYLDEERVAKGLPDNPRAASLAVRLGHVDRTWLADLRGDVLVVGCTVRGGDLDVPRGVVAAARRFLLPVAQRTAGTGPHPGR
ncbi:MAG: hypothetical protein ACRCYX_14745 [Dermatophilaceae bacterium]